jgi:antitoxin (DNA-binding transcriptional repressor) of toxin-antitoxin stability system
MTLDQLRALADRLEIELADRAKPVAPLAPADSAPTDAEPAACLDELLE